MRLALIAQTLGYLEGGGHFWAYLNWGLGLRHHASHFLWIETVDSAVPPEENLQRVNRLLELLAPFGLSSCVRLVDQDGGRLVDPLVPFQLLAAETEGCDLLLNLRYSLPSNLLRRFPRTALLDIDPGLMQYWVSSGVMALSDHDFYFSISERVGAAGSSIPDLGKRWHHVWPAVDLEAWKVAPCSGDGRYTSITHWHANEYVTEDGVTYDNTKRAAFLPLISLAGMTRAPLELAAFYSEQWDNEEMEQFRKLGWRVIHSQQAARDPESYYNYIQNSRGEISACKVSCVRMQNTWMSDRTVCYLASGKPAIVAHTGPSRELPDACGLWRFHTVQQAAEFLDRVEADYEGQCQAARALAERLFCNRRNAARVLEVALGSGG